MTVTTLDCLNSDDNNAGHEILSFIYLAGTFGAEREGLTREIGGGCSATLPFRFERMPFLLISSTTMYLHCDNPDNRDIKSAVGQKLLEQDNRARGSSRPGAGSWWMLSLYGGGSVFFLSVRRFPADRAEFQPLLKYFT